MRSRRRRILQAMHLRLRARRQIEAVEAPAPAAVGAPAVLGENMVAVSPAASVSSEDSDATIPWPFFPHVAPVLGFGADENM